MNEFKGLSQVAFPTQIFGDGLITHYSLQYVKENSHSLIPMTCYSFKPTSNSWESQSREFYNYMDGIVKDNGICSFFISGAASQDKIEYCLPELPTGELCPQSYTNSDYALYNDSYDGE